MINAAAISSSNASELIHPALLLEKYLATLSGARRFETPAPKVAVWMVDEFLKAALDPASRRVDPVASAISHQLADITMRAVRAAANAPYQVSELPGVLQLLRSFLRLLLENPPRAITEEELARADELKTFLRALRLRGQGQVYSRIAACV